MGSDNDSFSWFTGSYRNGAKNGNLRTTAPDASTSHQKAKIGINMSSGASYYMEWWYIFEWME